MPSVPVFAGRATNTLASTDAWRFPDLRRSWSDDLGISGLAPNAGDQEALKTYFRTEKWW